MSYAATARIKYSPSPVAETAQVALSANVPAPMFGESPMRPGSLPVTPPVDVPAARLPWLSSATQPTVPKRDSAWAIGASPRLLSTSWSNIQRKSVWK